MVIIHFKLKEILKQRNMTQKELSQKSGIRESAISDIVNNKRTGVNKVHLGKIINVLGIVDINELLELKEVHE